MPMTDPKVWLDRIRALPLEGPVRIMNVCGGHERSITMAGLRGALPGNIELIPGPGCPVCICPEEDVYEAIQLALNEDVTLLAFGDMLRVPVNVAKKDIRSLEQAKAAGADVVGMDDLHDQIKGGDLGFDVVIATPDAMRVVGKLGQLLGPRGLMPNPKVGTVTTDVEQAVQNAKAGQVRFRTDKAGIIHSTIGKVDFEVDALKDNLAALIKDLMKLKPASSKGTYLQKVAVSTTMGPGIQVDRASIEL